MARTGQRRATAAHPSNSSERGGATGGTSSRQREPRKKRATTSHRVRTVFQPAPNGLHEGDPVPHSPADLSAYILKSSKDFRKPADLARTVVERNMTLWVVVRLKDDEVRRLAEHELDRMRDLRLVVRKFRGFLHDDARMLPALIPSFPPLSEKSDAGSGSTSVVRSPSASTVSSWDLRSEHGEPAGDAGPSMTSANAEAGPSTAGDARAAAEELGETPAVDEVAPTSATTPSDELAEMYTDEETNDEGNSRDTPPPLHPIQDPLRLAADAVFHTDVGIQFSPITVDRSVGTSESDVLEDAPRAGPTSMDPLRIAAMAMDEPTRPTPGAPRTRRARAQVLASAPTHAAEQQQHWGPNTCTGTGGSAEDPVVPPVHASGSAASISAQRAQCEMDLQDQGGHDGAPLGSPPEITVTPATASTSPISSTAGESGSDTERPPSASTPATSEPQSAQQPGQGIARPAAPRRPDAAPVEPAQPVQNSTGGVAVQVSVDGPFHVNVGVSVSASGSTSGAPPPPLVHEGHTSPEQEQGAAPSDLEPPSVPEPPAAEHVSEQSDDCASSADSRSSLEDVDRRGQCMDEGTDEEHSPGTGTTPHVEETGGSRRSASAEPAHLPSPSPSPPPPHAESQTSGPPAPSLLDAVNQPQDGEGPSGTGNIASTQGSSDVTSQPATSGVDTPLVRAPVPEPSAAEHASEQSDGSASAPAGLQALLEDVDAQGQSRGANEERASLGAGTAPDAEEMDHSRSSVPRASAEPAHSLPQSASPPPPPPPPAESQTIGQPAPSPVDAVSQPHDEESSKVENVASTQESSSDFEVVLSGVNTPVLPDALLAFHADVLAISSVSSGIDTPAVPDTLLAFLADDPAISSPGQNAHASSGDTTQNVAETTPLDDSQETIALEKKGQEHTSSDAESTPNEETAVLQSPLPSAPTEPARSPPHPLPDNQVGRKAAASLSDTLNRPRHEETSATGTPQDRTYGDSDISSPTVTGRSASRSENVASIQTPLNAQSSPARDDLAAGDGTLRHEVDATSLDTFPEGPGPSAVYQDKGKAREIDLSQLDKRNTDVQGDRRDVHSAAEEELLAPSPFSAAHSVAPSLHAPDRTHQAGNPGSRDLPFAERDVFSPLLFDLEMDPEDVRSAPNASRKGIDDEVEEFDPFHTRLAPRASFSAPSEGSNFTTLSHHVHMHYQRPFSDLSSPSAPWMAHSQTDYGRVMQAIVPQDAGIPSTAHIEEVDDNAQTIPIDGSSDACSVYSHDSDESSQYVHVSIEDAARSTGENASRSAGTPGSAASIAGSADSLSDYTTAEEVVSDGDGTDSEYDIPIYSPVSTILGPRRVDPFSDAPQGLSSATSGSKHDRAEASPEEGSPRSMPQGGGHWLPFATPYRRGIMSPTSSPVYANGRVLSPLTMSTRLPGLHADSLFDRTPELESASVASSPVHTRVPISSLTPVDDHAPHYSAFMYGHGPSSLLYDARRRAYSFGHDGDQGSHSAGPSASPRIQRPFSHAYEPVLSQWDVLEFQDKQDLPR